MINILTPIFHGSGSSAESSGNISIGVTTDIPAYSLVYLNYVAIASNANPPPTPTPSGTGLTFELETNVSGGSAYQQLAQYTFRAVPTASISSGSVITVAPGLYLQVGSAALISVPNAQYESNGANAKIQTSTQRNSGTQASASLNTLSNPSNAFLVFGAYGSDMGTRSFAPDTSPALTELYDFTRIGGGRWSGQSLQYGLGTADVNPVLHVSMSATTNTNAITAIEVKANVPIETLHTIKSSSGDYTSLSAWEAAQQRDLVMSNSIAIAECYPFQDTTFVVIDGWIADTSHPIIMRTPSQHRPRTTWDTDAYRLSISSANDALQISESDVIVDGLQIRGVYGTQYQRNGFEIGGQVSGSVIIRNNNIVGDIVTWACYGIHYNKGSAPGNQTVLVYNNVVSGWMNPDGTGGDAVGIYMDQYGFQHVFNNTIVSCSIGLRATSNGSTISASNNLVYLCNTASFGTFDFASNNATDSSSIVGTNSRASQTFTFESGSYRLSTFDRGARTFGTDLSTIPTGSFTTDFSGNIRRRNWDIGAFQNNEQRIDIGSGGGNRITGSTVTLFIDDFNRANGPIGQNYESSAYTTGSYGTQSLTILNNQVRAPQTSRNCFSAVSPSAQTFSVDHEATVTYGALSTFDRAGPLVRGNPLSGSGYALTLDGTSAVNRRINKLLTGSYVLIDGLSLGNISIPVKVGDQVTLRAVGNTISAYKNNQLVDSVTDNDYSTGGPGLFYDSGNSNITYIDNFIATDIPPQGKIGQLMTITPT